MEIAFTSSAWKEWQKLTPKIKNYLEKKIKLYSLDTFKYAIKLKDNKIGEYRFRAGDYRIIFDLEKDKLIILSIGHRKNIYKS